MCTADIFFIACSIGDIGVEYMNLVCDVIFCFVDSITYKCDLMGAHFFFFYSAIIRRGSQTAEFCTHK